MLNQEDKAKPFLQNGGGPMNVPPRREPGPPVPCTRVTTELGVQVKRAESLHRKNECGSQNSGRSSRDGSYREKALEEIRNSLKPYATSDPHSEGIYEFSSASSSASESSGASQPPNSWGLLPNGLNQNLSMQQAFKQLIAMGHSEESAAYVLKMTSDDHLKEYEDSNHDQVNGVSKIGLSNTFKYKAQPKILDLQDSSSSSEYSAVVTSLRHKILPDPPKLIYANCENFKNKLTTDFSDVPPPLPPPRGTGACPPPTPPRHTPPPTTNGYKQSYLRRLSPVPTPSWQSRGTSPSRGNAPLVVVNNSQIHQQLAQQLQALSVNGSTISSPSRSEYHSSQNGKSSWYSSSPQPSYASSSSGRHSPTPTLSSSSEYSLYQLKQAPPPAYTPPSSYSSSPQPPYRTGPLQPMSSRQAKSQSPIIMQSVKSTQVQKPVLQTAVAPTSPPPSCTVASPVFTSQQQTSAAPPPYPIHKVTSTASLNSSSSQENNSIVPQLREQSSNPPPLYPRNPKPHSVSHTDPPPYSVTQPSIPPSPTPPPYTNPMWQTQQGVSASYLTTSVNQNVVPELPASTAESLKYHPPQDHRIEILQPAKWNSNEVANNGGVSPEISPLDNSLLSNVPTTDPPSYASSMAVLSAQRAAQRMTKLNNNNVPTLANNGPVKNACDDLSNSNLATTKAATSNLVNTVDSICTSQITALPGSYVNIINNGGMPEDAFSFFDNHHTTTTMLFRKPSPVAMDTASSASRSDSPVSRNINQSPVSFTSTMSTLPPSTQNESGCRKVVSHQSPPFPRKMLSKEKEKERRESKVRNYSPAAFKFFMEQHVENLLKSHQERETRRQQLESEMAKVGLTKEAQCEIRKMLHQKESNYIRLKRAKMNKSMFTKIKTIGIGAFGEVALVKKVDANQLYAMKTLRKSDVLKRNQVAHVKAERDILAEADNEWVVKLYYSFQDDENLYFVMDFIPGGDLMSLLIKYGVFTEQLARFYIAELVLAVESVHKMGFIHRDIKPDNILIDRDGHIKLTDFGLCTGFRWTHNSKYYQRNGEHGRQDSMDLEEKWSNECHCKPTLKPLERRRRREHQRCLAHSLVGTPNYIAPEVLLKTGYTQLCDWWSVGVILFEMLVGQPPFLANTPAETQYKVINWENTLRFPPRPLVADMAKELILKLCTRPEHRLGRNGVEEIKHHPFFHDIDLSSDLRKQPAPYVPSIRHPTDTSNFDPVDSEKIDESSCDGDMGNKQHPEHAFLEFTFRRFFDDGGHNVVYTGSRQPPIEEAAEKKSSPVYV